MFVKFIQIYIKDQITAQITKGKGGIPMKIKAKQLYFVPRNVTFLL
jgi:hypothetical protein